MKVAVVDYGMGNLRSVVNALERVGEGHSVYVARNAAELRRADRVVFPGQGAMPECMRHLRETNMTSALADAARNKPFFGVCMGQQMLFGPSEEGESQGMGLLPGRVVRLPPPVPGAADRLKVPHMGWNRVQPTAAHALWDGIAAGDHFYFVHSLVVQCDLASDVAATTDYGVTFTSAIARDNVFATQFHPEKSADVGLRLYRNFLSWQP